MHRGCASAIPSLKTGISAMKPKLFAQILIAKLTAWWRDSDDELLVSLVALNYHEFSAAESEVTAHQLANRARNSRYEP
jgi:hypothetical protein